MKILINFEAMRKTRHRAVDATIDEQIADAKQLETKDLQICTSEEEYNK